MQPQSQVLVELEDGVVTGLVLRAGKDGSRFMVTYEKQGRIETAWVPAELVRLLDLGEVP